MNLDQSNNDISMQWFGLINLSISILSMWDNDKEKGDKNLQKKWEDGLVRRRRAELGLCNLMAISQLLWMFWWMILEFDWI